MGVKVVLGNKSLFAKQWFESSIKEARKTSTHPSDKMPTFKSIRSKPLSPEQNNFSPTKYLTEGWTGESLASKSSIQFQKSIQEIYLDVWSQFNNHLNFTRSLKSSLLEEFQSFLNTNKFQHITPSNPNQLWSDLFCEEPTNEVTQFKKSFCMRVTVIYFYKIRFISQLSKQIQSKIDLTSAYNPNSFLTSIFKKGSSTELNTSVFETNIFSWYKPSKPINTTIQSLVDIIHELSITDIIKTISEIFKIETVDSNEYSHCFSHKNFGLFLNLLLINFPLWKSSVDSKSYHPYKIATNNLEIISSKFQGDFLESLSLSHWLAQENNSYMKWEQILCPEFKQKEENKSIFLKVCYRLQFLTFLAEVANDQNSDAVKFVTSIQKGHLYNKKSIGHNSQPTLLQDFSIMDSTYDRSILNLIHMPKNNPYHYVFSQITQSQKSLKDKGYLFVLTGQDIFTSSQKGKVDNLLKTMDVDAIFNFSELKGRGKVPAFLYILSKKVKKDHHPMEFDLSQSFSTNSVSHFRLSGQLESFHNFSFIGNLIERFFLGHLEEIPPMSHMEDENNFKLEFFQDVIVEGTLMNSQKNKSDHITHPSFFKNIVSSCLPLEYFFSVSTVDFESNHPSTFFPIELEESHAPYVIVVDKRIPKETSLEIIPYENVKSVSFEYGHTQCFYYGLSPKWDSFNLNCLRDFFSTRLGKQIIKLSFSSTTSRFKANLKKLLIPKFFHQKIKNGLYFEGTDFLSLSADELFAQSPHEFESQFESSLHKLDHHSGQYPHEMFKLLSFFKENIGKVFHSFGQVENSKKIDFGHEAILGSILSCETHSIYPSNPDIFIEFNPLFNFKAENPLLGSCQFQPNFNEDEFSVQIYSTKNELILSLHSSKFMCQLLDFIFAEYTDQPIAQLLQSTSLPTVLELDRIIQEFISTKQKYLLITKQIDQQFEHILAKSISK